MKIRVKYCGGCNPRYDRKAVVERLKTAFPDTEFVEADGDGPFEHVAVLCGCSAECASHGDLQGKHGKTVASSEEECQRLEEVLRSILK
jgi:hypothetical protein